MELLQLEEIIQQYFTNGNESQKYVDQISTALKSNDLQLLTLVEKLGFLLSSDDKTQRNNGLMLLIHVLQDTGHEILSKQEVGSLVTFFCSRLSDHHSLLPMALQGLVYLSAFPNLQESDVQSIAKCVFSEVPAAAQLQEDRRKIYFIFCNLLDNHISGLQHMRSEFILSYIQTMDGERDPRCLLMAFRIVSVLAKHFELGEHVEDLFEVIACYFPVDFRAPTEDQFGISREELSAALEDCLASTPLFAPFCVPLLMEKLNSDLDVAKYDALSGLQRCATLYGSNGLKPQLKNIWSAIRREVILGKDDKMSLESLKCLTAVVSVLSEDDCTDFLDSVWRECSQVILGDSELSVVSANLLRSAACGSSTSDRKTYLDKATSHMTQVIKGTEGTQRLSHVQAFAVLLDVPAIGPPGTWNCSEDCWALLISLLSSENDSLHSQNVTSFCWQCVDKLLQLGSALPKSESLPLVHRIFSQVSNSNTISNTKTAIIGTCEHLCRDYPEISETSLLPGLLEHLSNETTFLTDVLADICSSNPDFSELNILQPLMRNIPGKFVHEFTISKCLASLVLCQRQFFNQDGLVEAYLNPILNTALSDVYDEKPAIIDRPIYSAVEAIVAVLSPKAGLEVAEDLLRVVMLNQPCIKWGNVTPQSFQSLPKCSQLALAQLLRSVLPHLAMSTDPCSLQDVVRWLMSVSSLHDDIAQTLSGLANKCVCCGKLAFELLQESQMNSDLILLLVWVTKALLLSNHPDTKQATEMLLTLLADPIHGQQVAAGFEIILSPSKNVLKPSSHANIALFYAQKFFALTAPFLLKSYEQTENETKTRSNYLCALCCQLKCLPLPVLKQELPKLLPVLVATMDPKNSIKDLDLLLSCLDALGLLLVTENASLVSVHLTTIIPRLLEHARAHESMKIRIAAFRCLSELPSLPAEQILIYKGEVLLAVKSCLDDRKRLVRKEAAKAACYWHLVAAETS